MLGRIVLKRRPIYAQVVLEDATSSISVELGCLTNPFVTGRMLPNREGSVARDLQHARAAELNVKEMAHGSLPLEFYLRADRMFPPPTAPPDAGPRAAQQLSLALEG